MTVFFDFFTGTNFVLLFWHFFRMMRKTLVPKGWDSKGWPKGQVWIREWGMRLCMACRGYKWFFWEGGHFSLRVAFWALSLGSNQKVMYLEFEIPLCVL